MKVKNFTPFILVFFIGLSVLAGCAKPPTQDQTPQRPENLEVILATTTSTRDSGLLDVLIPQFEQKTGYTVKTVAVGTGAALAMGERGEADALLVHAPADEKKLIDSGVGINYQLIMHNDFVIIGPDSDPASIRALDAADAFKKIAGEKRIFISRGDDSGTNKKELAIWSTAQITPEGSWYQKSGTGMGQTITIANEKLGYTLSDRATYLAQKKNINLVILSEGDKTLLNIYHVMQVNPEKFEKVNAEGGKAFVDFMVDPETQKVIGDFGKEQYGQPLFFPDAGKKEEDLGK